MEETRLYFGILREKCQFYECCSHFASYKCFIIKEKLKKHFAKRSIVSQNFFPIVPMRRGVEGQREDFEGRWDYKVGVTLF